VELDARYVIHGAVMGQDLVTDAELVRRTTRACLALADELGCESLALPAFGTGVGGFPLGECARIMVAEARAVQAISLRRAIFASTLPTRRVHSNPVSVRSGSVTMVPGTEQAAAASRPCR